MNGLDAARIVLGGNLTPDRIQGAIEDPVWTSIKIRGQLMESAHANGQLSYLTGDPVPQDGKFCVAISRKRLPRWEDPFVDGVMLPLLYAPRVVVEDPIAYAVGLRLDKTPTEVLANYLAGALHVTQQLAPLIDDRHVVLVGIETEIGGPFGAPFRSLIRGPDAPLNMTQDGDAYWDLALFFGCDFLASPWLPKATDMTQLSSLIERLTQARGDLDIPDTATKRPALQEVSRFLVPDLRSLDPIDIVRLRSTKIHSQWTAELTDAVTAGAELSDRGEDLNTIRAHLLARIEIAAEQLSGLSTSRGVGTLLRQSIRDTSVATMGLAATTPFQPLSSVAVDAVGAAGVVSLTALISAIRAQSPALRQRQLAEAALNAHFNVFLTNINTSRATS